MFTAALFVFPECVKGVVIQIQACPQKPSNPYIPSLLLKFQMSSCKGNRTERSLIFLLIGTGDFLVLLYILSNSTSRSSIYIASCY